MFKIRWNNSFGASRSACIIDLWICIPMQNFSVLEFSIFTKKKGLTHELKRIENGTPSEFSFCWDSLLLFRSHLADFRCIFQIATYCAMSANPNQRWLNCRTPFLMLCTAFAIHTTELDDVENCLARKTYLKVKSIVTRETWERKTIEAIRSRKLFYAFLLSQPCTKRSIFPPIITQCITVFENHRKSLIQNCERSELRLHFEWTKVH
mgnify:CR=1 FL=1